MQTFLNTKEEREKLKDLLLHEDVAVRFIKANGEHRLITGTLRPALIDQVYKKSGRNRMQNDETQAVWDLELEAWRAFRWDHLVGYEVI